MNDFKSNGKRPAVKRFDVVGDAVAARAAAIAIERAAQRLADQYDANPDEYALAYAPDPYGEGGFELRPVASELRAA